MRFRLSQLAEDNEVAYGFLSENGLLKRFCRTWSANESEFGNRMRQRYGDAASEVFAKEELSFSMARRWIA